MLLKRCTVARRPCAYGPYLRTALSDPGGPGAGWFSVALARTERVPGISGAETPDVVGAGGDGGAEGGRAGERAGEVVRGRVLLADRPGVGGARRGYMARRGLTG